MNQKDLTELYEYCYRDGKTINKGRANTLIVQRINELRDIKRDTTDELEIAQIDNEMEDLDLLRKRL
jgi:hypothetical protein